LVEVLANSDKAYNVSFIQQNSLYISYFQQDCAHTATPH